MNDEVVLTVAAIAALVVLVAIFKLLGSAIKALVLALIAATALYFLLPRLEKQEGAIGDAARKAMEVTGDLEGSVKSLKDQAVEAGRKVNQGLDDAQKAAEAAKETQEALREAQEAARPGAGK